jgi:uncharacterized membrane protein YkvA (DUF1232 family)
MRARIFPHGVARPAGERRGAALEMRRAACNCRAVRCLVEGDPMWLRLTRLWAVVRGDVRRLWFALRHPGAPRWLKLGTVLILLYVLSPIDLIPDAIPLLGVVDALVIVPLAIRWLLARLPADVQADVSRRAAMR